MDQFGKRLRQLPPLAYISLVVSFIGVAAEVTFHFAPPYTLPPVAGWFATLSAADQDFFVSAYELTAHFFIGLGLTGMLTAFAQVQLRNA